MLYANLIPIQNLFLAVLEVSYYDVNRLPPAIETQRRELWNDNSRVAKLLWNYLDFPNPANRCH